MRELLNKINAKKAEIKALVADGKIEDAASAKEELKKLGLNQCDSHVDFMIGNKDLEIIGLTYDNQEIKIFENGNFTQEFK